MDVRAAAEAEIEHLATIWHEGWQDAHRHIVPAELTRLRSRESFAERLRAGLAQVRVSGPSGAPAGFCMTRDDELYQLYVSRQLRGMGIAAALLADAEAGLSRRGVATAWLACAIGNERAAKFYEKCGWHRTGTVTLNLETSQGAFPLEVWRYQKSLHPAG
jgi:ribosomal protein S18 acetylase RimI-like enzyme